ncbi:MAG: amidohydrolase [Saprospiraceae bacterium]|nr:amidohydrolase [Saprospiraceae bacterium]
MPRIPLVLIAFLLLISACNSPAAESDQAADLILHNAQIITMDEGYDDQQKVEAVAVKDNKIIGVGKRKELRKFKGEHTEMRDLQGKTLLPGFIDGHSHFAYGLRMLVQANISSPPVAEVRNIPDLIATLKAHQEKRNIPRGEWILGWGYDPDQLEEQRHPNQEELSNAFPNHPVYIRHASFHMGVANEVALQMAGIDDDTQDPVGGVIVRDEQGKATGLLQETAQGLVARLIPPIGPVEMLDLISEGQNYYASFGITTMQEGLADSLAYEVFKEAAALEQFIIDLEVLGSFRNLDYYLKEGNFGQYNNGLKLAGIKITTDGSPQGKTAYFKDPYKTKVPGCIHDCRGYPMVPSSYLQQVMTRCYDQGVQLFAHANGDAAIDMLLDTHQKVTDSLGLPSDEQRTVVIHSQFVRPDQLDRYIDYGFVPSFFTNHAFFWGDTHTANLGPERANFLSPVKTADEMGIIATNHTDYPVTPPDQLFLLWTSVVRQARSGNIMGKDQRASVYQGLKAITINGAYQHHTEDIKGSISLGKLADFVVLDKNPLTVHVDDIKDIQVMETIKGGYTVFEKK